MLTQQMLTGHAEIFAHSSVCPQGGEERASEIEDGEI